MATFTISGYDIRSDANKMVTQTEVAQLQYVSPLGMASLDYRYTYNAPNSAEVSLSDYNIILNGTHLNDAALPERIEVFTLTWNAQGIPQTTQVMNLAFGDAADANWRDCLFAIDGAHLPDLTDPGITAAFFDAAAMTVPARASMETDFTIRLANMPGVEVDGVIARMFAEQDGDPSEQDRFDFSLEPDIQHAALLTDDIVLPADQNGLAATAGPPAEETDNADVFEAFLPETGYDDFAS